MTEVYLPDEFHRLGSPMPPSHTRLFRQGARTVPVSQPAVQINAEQWREQWLTSPPNARTLQLFGRMILEPFFSNSPLDDLGDYLARAPQVLRQAFDDHADTWPQERIQAVLQAVPAGSLPRSEARWRARERAQDLADSPSPNTVGRRRRA